MDEATTISNQILVWVSIEKIGLFTHKTVIRESIPFEAYGNGYLKSIKQYGMDELPGTAKVTLQGPDPLYAKSVKAKVQLGLGRWYYDLEAGAGNLLTMNSLLCFFLFSSICIYILFTPHRQARVYSIL